MGKYENTSIHTKIDCHRRISSIYRTASIVEYELWFWETFVWNDNEIIEDLTDSGITDPNGVVEIHLNYLKNL